MYTAYVISTSARNYLRNILIVFQFKVAQNSFQHLDFDRLL